MADQSINRPVADSSDSYMKRFVTYIPTEVLALYVAVGGFVKTIHEPLQLFVWFTILVFFLIATPIWILRTAEDKKRHPRQAFAATLAFAAWAFASGGPFQNLHWYNPEAAGIVLMLVCFSLPLIGNDATNSSEKRQKT